MIKVHSIILGLHIYKIQIHKQFKGMLIWQYKTRTISGYTLFQATTQQLNQS